MNVQDIMSTHVETIAPDALLVQANEQMWRKRIHHLVVTQNDTIVGVISDTDLGGDSTDTIPDQIRVQEKMTPSIVTGRPDMTIKEVKHLMQGHHIRCLPVVNKHNKLVGIITQNDLETLEKRGTAQAPFERDPRESAYVPLSHRDQRGSKSKHGHSEWPRPHH